MGILKWIAAALCALTATAAQAQAPDPQALAQEMVQGARKTMVESPAQAERIAAAFAMQLQDMPDSRSRTIAMAKAYWMAGEAASRLRQHDKARRRLGTARQLADRGQDQQTLADVMLSQATLDEDTGRLAVAIREYQTAFRIYQQLGNARSQSITFQNLGGLYVRANDLVKGERYIRQASEVYRKEPMVLAIIHNTLGSLYQESGRLPEAAAEFTTAIGLARRMDMPSLEAQLLANQVRIMLGLGDVPEATRLYRRASTLFNAGMARTDNHIAVGALLAVTRGDTQTASRLMAIVEAGMAGRKPVASDQDMQRVAYLVYRGLGRYPQALAHLEVATSLERAATKETMAAQNALLGAQFDFANQDLRIAQMKGDAIAREAGDQRRAFAWAGACAAVILATLLAGLVITIRARRRVALVNAQLEATNADLTQALEEVVLRERSERLAIQLSEQDPLTALPNRRHLRSKMLHDVIAPDEDPDDVVVMLMDLDRFKAINDIHGHEIGDLLLVEVANRLREIGGRRGAKAVRLGGDEFVFVAKVRNDVDAAHLADETIKTLSLPFDIESRRLTIGVSIGISRYGHDGTEVSDLLRKADISMYEAKKSGRNAYRFFDEMMDLRLRERAQTEADLRAAVQEGQIEVHYQPIHDFTTGRTASFEALARWTHPLRGNVPPDEFIPLAEEIGIISALTDQVLRQACRDAREWPDDVCVSVNLSPVLLGDEWIAPRVFATLAEEGLAPRRLIMEITETAVISDLEHAAEVITSFRDSGIRVALDDFGKGHSSLSQLHELAFDYLKLDSSFVRTLDNADSMKISTAVSGLASAMELPVTAEGVETAEAAETLRRLGFSYGQGYLYGRPMTAPQAKELAWTVDGAMTEAQAA